jgi:hypothetical protein
LVFVLLPLFIQHPRLQIYKLLAHCNKPIHVTKM